MKHTNIYAGVIFGLLVSTNCFSQIITTIAGTGTGGYNGDGIPATTAQLNNPNSVNILPLGTIIMTDGYNHRIRTIDQSGIINTYVGNGTQGWMDGPVNQAVVAEATGICYDQQGNLYFADFAGHRVRKITTVGTVTTIAGTGVAGYGGDGGPGTSAQLNHPCGLWISSQGEVYFADRDNHRVRKIDLNGNITTVAGTGSGSYCGDGGPATSACLNMPNKVAIDTSGNIYIADAMNHRVRKITNGTISTFAGTGVAGFSGDGVPAASTQLNRPMGLGIDAAGNIYIADFYNNRYRRVNHSGIISTFAGTGVAGSNGDGGPPTSAQLTLAYGINFDHIGTAYILDQGSNKIRKVTCVQPTVTAISSSSLICAGQSATISASGSDLYTWSNGATGGSIQVTPSVTTSYTVTGTNSVTGCKNSTVVLQDVSACSGIEEVGNEASELHVYPNPSDGKLIVSSNSETNLWLINSIGQAIRTEKLSKTNNYEIELSGIASGVYFLTTENGLRRKIIVLKSESK